MMFASVSSATIGYGTQNGAVKVLLVFGYSPFSIFRSDNDRLFNILL